MKKLLLILLFLPITAKQPLYKQQADFAKDVAKLISFIFESGYLCTFGEAWRTQEQALIYFHKAKGIKNSLHCKRLAIDINLFTSNGDYISDSAKYAKFGNYWESLSAHNKWGGKFKNGFIDGNHFQRKEEIY